MNFNDTLAVDDGAFGLYARGPHDDATAAVIVLQEIFGVNANIRSTVDRLAALGYHAVAPDLFWRQRPGVDLDPGDPDSREAAMALARTYRESPAEGMADLAALVAALRRRHSKIGVVGYCLGGRVAFQCWLAFEVDAVVSFYGVGIDGLLCQLRDGRPPLLMHLGANDPLNPPPVQNAIVAALERLENAQVEIHGGVGHAFARLGGASYVEEAARRADSATFDFLARHLK